jgi:hypothetical protein
MVAMKPRDYFKTIDAVYINLDVAKERRASIEHDFGNTFRSLTRVEPVHFDDMFSAGVDAKMRLIESAESYDEKGYFKCSEQYKKISADRFKKRKGGSVHANSVWTPEQYAAQESLSQTSRKILQAFLNTSLNKLMILEDDARARDFMNQEIDIPDDADILVWGGAVTSAQSDANRFAKNTSFWFSKIDGKHNAWYTTAYEVSRAGASKLLEEYNFRPAYTTDTVWRYAFDEVDTYRLSPMGFVQGASSYLADAGVAMPLTRDEAAAYCFEDITHRTRIVQKNRMVI